MQKRSFFISEKFQKYLKRPAALGLVSTSPIVRFIVAGEAGEFVGKIVRGDPLKEFEGYRDRKATSKKILEDVFRNVVTGNLALKPELLLQQLIARNFSELATFGSFEFFQ